MWQRWLRNLNIELSRLRWRRSMDMPTGLAGILTICFGLLLILVLGNGLAQMFRVMIPWVSGYRYGDVYWASIALSLKAGLTFLLFCISLASFLLLRFSRRR